MATRPIDIARKLHISTTTLRNYEALGLIPPVSRSTSGYRVFTDEHIAYFICIREMLAGFRLARISKILKEVMARKIDSALWMVNKAQADLQQERIISEKIVQNLLHKNSSLIATDHEFRTINDVSRETGIPATTIRYWDRVGLITIERHAENNYRMFTAKHVRQILTIYALKLSGYPDGLLYSVERAKQELKEFDYSDRNRIIAMTDAMQQQLDQANRLQVKGIAALYHLCVQVETNHFDHPAEWGGENCVSPGTKLAP